MQPGGNQQRPGPDVPRWALAIVFVVVLSFVGPWFFIRAIAEPHSLHTAAFIPDPAPPMGNRSLTTGNSLLLPVAPKAASLPDGHSPTATASATPSATPTATSSPTATPTSTPTATSTATPTATSTGPVAGWWDSRWRARLKIEVGGGGYARSDAIVEATLNFTQKLQEVGLTGALDDSHLRVVETDPTGALLDDEVPFQFDRDQNYEASSRATGQLIFLVQSDTGASQTRHFYVYYDTLDNAPGKTEAVVIPQVRYEGTEDYEGQNSYKIVSDNAAYYYHRAGGGFASLIDRQGIDWISYHPTGGADGNYRGIPNVATIGGDGALLGLFHPGYTSGSSDLLGQGPIKITILSQDGGNAWGARWEIYPRYARMTLYEKPSDRPYWFLYEGTPGGSISSGDYYVLPDGIQQDLYTSFSADLPGEEWIYYGDDEADQVLYLVNALPDDAEDCHYIMQDSMTIFGFGRAKNQSSSPMLQAEPGIFLVGFLDAGTHATIQTQIQAAYKPLTISVGSGQSQ